jgi:hypothetical protein
MSSLEFSKNTAGEFLESISKESHRGVSSCFTARLRISRSCEQKCDYVLQPLSTSLFLLIKFEFLNLPYFTKYS